MVRFLLWEALRFEEENIFKSTSTRLAAVAPATALDVCAQAATFAAFDEPSLDGSTPLFAFNNVTGILIGGWSGTGLTLKMPLDGAVYHDARFTLAPVSEVGSFGPFIELGPGEVDFATSSSAPIFQANFSGALLDPGSFSAGSSLSSGDVHAPRSN